MKTISLIGRYQCPKLFARLVWQELFNYYRTHKGSLDHLDNLLIDLRELEEFFEKHYLKPDHNIYCLYWELVGWATYMRDVNVEPYTLKIEWDTKKWEVNLIEYCEDSNETN